MGKHVIKRKSRCSEGFLHFEGKDKMNSLNEYPYCRRVDFLSGKELVFFKVLLKAVDSRYVVCPRVRLKDIFFVKCRDINDMNTYLGNIGNECVDFLLCRSDDMFPVCGINLYDSSEINKVKNKKDNFLEELFDKTGVALVRFPAKNDYMVPDIMYKIEIAIMQHKENRLVNINYLKVDEAQVIEQSDVNKETVNDSQTVESELVLQKDMEKHIRNNKVPVCPKCGRSMRLKEAKRGPRKGQKYYCCSGYPSCNEVFLLKQD